MTSTFSTPIPAPFSLRLFDSEDTSDIANTPISPHITLTEFYARWYQPIVLASQKSVAQGTETIYRNALAWWSIITGDPPLRMVDEFTVAKFIEGLRTRTYRRGMGVERKLSASSIAKHLRQIRAILFRAGPNIDAKRPSKGLMLIAPLVSVPRVDSQPKGCFSIEQAAAMSGAADRMAAPELRHATPGEWWRAYLGWLYATGLRAGTVSRLQWSMLREERDGWWLDVPAHLVPKTRKAISMALPAWAFAMVSLWPRSGEIFAQPNCRDWMKQLHKRLQAIAGIAPPLSLQAWRRTHGRQMAELGLGYATDIARRALDHSDARTTTSHYVSLENDLRRKLPNPFSAAKDRQHRLFD